MKRREFITLVGGAWPLLPYGSQRLMEIALALATRPRVLLDEPAAGVPAAHSEAVFEAHPGAAQGSHHPVRRA